MTSSPSSRHQPEKQKNLSHRRPDTRADYCAARKVPGFTSSPASTHGASGVIGHGILDFAFARAGNGDFASALISDKQSYARDFADERQPVEFAISKR